MSRRWSFELERRPGRTGPERFMRWTAPPLRRRSAESPLAEDARTQLQHHGCSLSTTEPRVTDRLGQPPGTAPALQSRLCSRCRKEFSEQKCWSWEQPGKSLQFMEDTMWPRKRGNTPLSHHAHGEQRGYSLGTLRHRRDENRWPDSDLLKAATGSHSSGRNWSWAYPLPATALGESR